MTEQRKGDAFFNAQRERFFAVGFDDLRLRTDYSEILPEEVVLQSKFSRNVGLQIPIVSSPMDTVTEAKMAIAMAMAGGLGIIHKGLSADRQAAQIAKVKHCLNAFISDPICISADNKVADVLRMKEEKDYGFSSFPVVNNDNKFIGIVTGNDFEFCHNPKEMIIADIMSTNALVTDSTDLNQAYQIMRKNHKKILPVVDDGGRLLGIYTWTDIKRIMSNNASGFNLDSAGTLIVGAAIGVHEDDYERTHLLADKGVNVFVVDTAHGDSLKVIKMVRYLKKHYPDVDVVAGNISEGESAKRLVVAGVDGIRVGQGPGSICTTRIVSGIGHPQVSAIHECAKAIRGSGVPVCADGGIKYSGDITIAIGAGADNVMLGNLLAGTTEAPGEVIFRDGKALKLYRGMGSLGAMLDNKASRERYGQTGKTSDKLVPEGVEGAIQFKGEVANILFQLIGGLKSGMGYTGANDLATLQQIANFYLVSVAGMQESHPHDLYFVKDAPNYRR
ncbi:IMP dehydrogenase [Candidatus Falkowbacteria bacterium]|nr:IMP dehydrogenase [Candidatus Falkowbacteria bacterium]